MSALTSEQIYDEEPLTSTLRPDRLAIITVRIIKSFPYRTEKNYVFHNIDLIATTAPQLLGRIKDIVASQGAFRAYRNVDLDTVKIYTHAHGAKTTNLIINFDHDDDWILSDPNKSLHDYGVENETELSVFNFKDYQEYKANPVDKWI